ncbi:MAG TPA: deoxyribodipyrimidine photo-lyase [Ilumatobacteraceae bacterium]
MWFRRDLRLGDHPALHAAVATGLPVVPLFVVDPAFAGSGAPRRAYMTEALRSLDRSIDGALVYRVGDPTIVVPRLAAEVGAEAVFVSRDFGSYGRRRDSVVAERLRADGRSLLGRGSPYAVEPGSIVKDDGTPYAMFTPFLKRWRTANVAAPLDEPNIEWLGAPTIQCDGPPADVDASFQLADVGEVAARSRWSRFAAGPLHVYDEQRNLPANDASSHMSADLRWGVVHPRQLMADLAPTKAETVFASELAWRDFYADLVHRRPESLRENLDRRMDAVQVDTDQRARDRFSMWCAGRTGYSIVDAGMRQLLAIGWMHNRVRMIAASFLVKDLHLPWQWGARHFMNHLVDGDAASNAHGWQWAAGTGTDAAPYYRVFNPTTQAERFDPDGEFARRWIPEFGGPAYPSPMVDHAAERIEALRRYRLVAASSR